MGSIDNIDLATDLATLELARYQQIRVVTRLIREQICVNMMDECHVSQHTDIGWFGCGLVGIESIQFLYSLT